MLTIPIFDIVNDMLLKRLELVGFKSFAKPVILEFPTPISAIVGPNGSGKSNVADAIRWVLGEQSMKSLRGKKGEDFIFGGTTQISRMGKASVSLVFDNVKKIFPYEFDEVIISRKVYRDGVNEYLLNNSPARLKDVVELLSSVGLGASQHHIIGQGDADRILYSSLKERKSMVEEALGLKIFELKKNESERKLAQTEENIKHVESLRRELKPHLKYLEEQARKSQSAAKIKQDLALVIEEYVSKESCSLDYESESVKTLVEPLEAEQRALEGEIRALEESFSGKHESQDFFTHLKKFDETLEKLSLERRTLEREAAKKEADMARAQEGAQETMPTSRHRSVLNELRERLDVAVQQSSYEELRNAVFEMTQRIYRLLEEFVSDGFDNQARVDSRELDKLNNRIATIETEEKKILSDRRALEEEYRKKISSQEDEARNLKNYHDRLNAVRDRMRELNSRQEQLRARKEEFEREFAQYRGQSKSSTEGYDISARDAMLRKIERLRIRLEEAGGVDESVIQEFDDTKKREEFLAKELADLDLAQKQVRAMVDELDTKIERDFSNGLDRINNLFGQFFRDIFGGGKAEIFLTKPEKKSKQSLEDIEETASFDEASIAPEEREPGIEIRVDIPRKRIKSLAMLSGGERALTSIALLFAMSTVNPPPFLVLDETDAALDEANSTRYGVMLQELSKKTQLVVITHNRATMKSASILYGVTMGDDGVSRLLSVRLEEAEEVLAKKN